MDFNFTIDTQTPPDFSDKDLADILDKAPVLDDIERYRSALKQYIHDQDLLEKWVTHTAATLAQASLNHSIGSLFDCDVGEDPDPHAKLDEAIAGVDAIKADVEQRTTGPHAQKLLRRYEALMEVYATLEIRVAQYKSDLPTQRALALRFTDDEDAQPAQGVATPSQTPPA